jgi:ADP-heptose:LPS heptosyltransferase
VTGSRAERPLALAIAAAAELPDGSVLAGSTGLVGLARLVAAAGRVVSGDTGVAHLATALDTPSVTLFGPTSPGEWGPPAGRGRHRVLWSGRSGDPHGERPDPGLLEIGAADVIGELERLRA